MLLVLFHIDVELTDGSRQGCVPPGSL
jgi:hypothetical protein